jgi:hypothetical protein
MPKHTFKETTEVNNKVFFAGEAELDADDLKALKELPAETGTEEPGAEKEPSRKGK